MPDEPALRIPLSFLSTVRSFAALSPDVRNNVRDTFTTTEQLEDRPTLISAITNAVDDWTRDDSATFLEFLVSLYDLDRVLEVGDLTAVAGMIARSEDLHLADVDRSALSNDLAVILGSPQVNRFARAQDLSSEYERVLEEVRIISDIRPIFDPRNPAIIDGALITHSLRLRYKGRDGPDRYVSLDRDRLLRLQRQVNRAVEKQRRLEKFLKDTALPFIEVDER